MSESRSLVKTQVSDLASMADFVRKENNDSHISSDYLKWWYFQNSSKSFSFWQYNFENSIVGMATTNNFRIQATDGIKLAGMPQKVLTSETMRGKGLFGKLFWQTEKDNLENGVELFLTFTNEMSTPIFLKKFGYLRGKCPDVIMAYPSLKAMFGKQRYEVVENARIEQTPAAKPNEFVKDADYFNWRYFSNNIEPTLKLRVFNEDKSVAGYIFLKKVFKKKLPLFVLLDLLPIIEGTESLLLAEAVKYASKHLSLGLLALDNSRLSPIWANHFHKRIENRFNFLVKGKTEEESLELAKTDFDFAFGQLDFI